MRHSLDFANWKERKPLAARAAADLHRADGRRARRDALDAFEASPWGQRFPTVVQAWRRAWTHVIPFFAFPPDDPPRDLHDQRARKRARAAFAKIIKTRGHFPTDDAATKLIWLALRNITADVATAGAITGARP